MSRLLAATVLEARVELRYGIVPAAAALGVVWTLLLFAVPVGTAGIVAPYLLFLDTAAFGALFAAALLLFERTEGARDALNVTPLRYTEAISAKLTMLTALSLLIALPMTVVAARDRIGDLLQVLVPVMAGVALTSLLLLALCLITGARTRDLSGFLLVAPLGVGPLIIMPLVHISGLFEHPLLYLVPSTVGADLIRLGTAPASVEADPLVLGLGTIYALVWVVASVFVARRAFENGPVPVAPPRADSGSREASAVGPVTGRGNLPAVVRFARIDLFGAGRDPLLLLMLCAPVLLALVIRFFFPVATDFLRSSYGFDLEPHSPVILAALVLLHVPMMFGVVGGLRAVEDMDESVLLVLRVTPLSLPVYLAYRMAVIGVLTLLGLAIALPLSGLLVGGWSAGMAVAVLLAALQAPILLTGMTALASNKVEAMVVVKGIGALLVLSPVAAWLLPAPWNLLLLPLPPTWPVLALPGYTSGPLGVWVLLLGGFLMTAVVTAAFLRRTVDRLGDG
ncbi:fluoroquinolone export ABC transporter permease subunit [Nocardiopsis kunsanensis]|uniref:ABC transporter permease n=1 Tax=Nocardiopsis kunsanensis TaxID=141693 RepID=A0A919CJW4_9ACTN|nr:hypothetical protein [Nocardiopsis kunsanensis]GHD31603.1 hypothetical protein GCM10007147_34510 [Nocardiopsis kunsanensis]